MEVKELKTKVKIVFPEESEIFMAEEFLEALHGVSLAEKPLDLDFSGVQSLDTVFLQLALGIVKSAEKHSNKYTVKSSEALEKASALYGINIEGNTGGDK